jgi:ACS family glucarate transporter-like MFS transporter
VTRQELEETEDLTALSHHAPPWRLALRSRSLWALMGAAFSCVYTYSFFQSWLHTYLVKAHGYSQNDLLLSSLPYIVGALANLTGGLASGALLKRMGLQAARCWLGAGALGISAVCAIAVPFVGHWLWALVLLSIVYGAIAFQQPAMFAVCLDIGGEHGGAATGAMNSAAQAGSFVSSLAFGYLVEHYDSYNVPFIPMAALLVLGAWLWLKIDPKKSIPESM